ncbi:nitrogenase component 1 [Lacrimispora algidixylanolytica]|uniref:Hydrogenase n=1 Tax=Lacrimispora algidixylanolytica TaxID=94868 RepID=A0A419T894_9FIRM|nr:nitrogenase component 1 [Lacrimispora algidixylanolytica]RKD33701.1 hydrogenase [Lacrimispora algidixylanolytica]
MAKILDKQRYKCAMSAMQTVQAIDRAIPILHSGPGCAQKLSSSSGSSGYFSPNIYPCTSINEKDVVFGGVKKLESTIRHSLDVIDADLYVVLTGCIPEIVGDNTEEVVEGFKDAKKPVIYASTAGFKGNNYKGHEEVIDSIVDQLLEPSDIRVKNLVNIWADVPYQNEFWHGNFRELERLIEKLGLVPNIIFGYNKGLSNVKKIPAAQFNLLISPWVGLNNMKKMEQKLKIPYLHYPTLPIGAFETSKFLRTVGRYAGVPEEKVEAIIEEQEAYYYYYIERYADLFLETRVMSKQFTVVSDAHYALGITKFLVNDLGLYPAKQFVVDDTPKGNQEAVSSYFKDLNYGIEAEVSFETDGYKIHNEIKAHDYHGYPLILGGYWEKEVAKQTNAHFLNVSWPVNERLIMNSYYVGYDGGLKLIEDIYSVAKTRFN